MADLQIPQNINAKKLIEDATIGFGLVHVLSDSEEASIFKAERDIKSAQGEVRDANSEVNAAEDKQKSAEAEGNDAQTKQQDGESESKSGPTQDNVEAKGNDASSIAHASQTRSQSMVTSSENLSRASSVFENMIATSTGNIDGFSIEITSIQQQNQSLMEQNRALMEQMAQESTFDGTGSGTSSAYSLSTATEVEEQQARNPQVMQGGQGSSSNLQATIEANNAQIEANGSKADGLSQQAQAEEQNVDAQTSQAQATVQEHEAAAADAQNNNESEQSTLQTIGEYAQTASNLGGTIDGIGDAVRVAGIGVTAAGTALATTGGAVGVTGATVTGIGAAITAVGAPLCALFGIGVPIVGAGGTTTGSGVATTTTGGTVAGTGTGLVGTGQTIERVGDGISMVGNGLKLAGDATTVGVKVAEGDVMGAVQATANAVSSAAAFSSTIASSDNIKGICEKVYNGASAVREGISAYQSAENGDIAGAIAHGVSTVGFGFGASDYKYKRAVSDFSNGISAATGAVQSAADGDYANAALQGTQALFNFASGVGNYKIEKYGLDVIAKENKGDAERYKEELDKNKDPLNDVPDNWSTMTAEERQANLRERQARHQEWLASQNDIDPMLKPIPKEYEFPEDFSSLSKDEQKAFRQKRKEFLEQREQEHASWLLAHNGIEADERSGLTSESHHRYVQDYSSEDLGRAGIQVDDAAGSTISFDGQHIETAHGERADISYRQYLDARVDGEHFRSADLNQDITDLEIRMYAHGASEGAALNGADVNSRSALSRTPRAIEMGLSQDEQLISTAHDLATNAYAGRALSETRGYELIDEISDTSTGLRAKAYKKDGRVYITYSGSADKADFRVDHQMIDGHLPDQYTGAVAFKDRIRQRFPDSDVIVTGHSLGGSLSQLVASSDSEVLAVTFDAVGTKQIVRNNGLSDNGNSCNIIVNGDVISSAYEHVGYTARLDGNGVAGQVTRPDGEVVTVRTTSAHALDATSNASEMIRVRETQLDDKIMHDAPAASDTSSRNYSVRPSVVEVTTAEATNDWWRKQGYTEPPYLPGTEVQVVRLTEPTTFVRVMDGDNSGVFGGWVMRADDLLRSDGTPLTPLEIQQKFALKTTPTHVVDVTLPAGTTLRMGDVNPLEAWGKEGGGTQFDLMGQRVGQFDNARRIEDLRIKKN